jgi:hypothetical protein
MRHMYLVKRKSVKLFSWLSLFLLARFLLPLTAHAQFAVYGELTASDLHEGPSGDYLYGGTAGALLDAATFKRMILSADLQVRDVNNSGERFLDVAIGPRFSFPLEKLKLNPYVEFMVGFARYRATTVATAQNTTDDQWQANAGVARPISPRFDVVADYSYSQYGANLGEYHPKSYSAGVIFHLVKR